MKNSLSVYIFQAACSGTSFITSNVFSDSNIFESSPPSIEKSQSRKSSGASIPPPRPPPPSTSLPSSNPDPNPVLDLAADIFLPQSVPQPIYGSPGKTDLAALASGIQYNMILYSDIYVSAFFCVNYDFLDFRVVFISKQALNYWPVALYFNLFNAFARIQVIGLTCCKVVLE